MVLFRKVDFHRNPILPRALETKTSTYFFSIESSYFAVNKYSRLMLLIAEGKKLIH